MSVSNNEIHSQAIGNENGALVQPQQTTADLSSLAIPAYTSGLPYAYNTLATHYAQLAPTAATNFVPSLAGTPAQLPTAVNAYNYQYPYATAAAYNPYAYYQGIVPTLPATQATTNLDKNNKTQNKNDKKSKSQSADDDDEDDDPTIDNGNKKTKANNVLPFFGNEKTMNLNHLILTNIQQSPYFKTNLYQLKTYHEVIDEIYYQVKHLEPWEKGSRKLSGQTGMCGSVRGVGSGGIVSTAFCILYKLYTLKLTRKQLNGLLKHKDSPYIRALGFMYIRFTQPPADFWKWFEPYLDDKEIIEVKSGLEMTIGEMCRQMLTKLDWFQTLFPRMPVPTQKDIEKKLYDYDKKLKKARTAHLEEGELEDEKDTRKSRDREYSTSKYSSNTNRRDYRRSSRSPKNRSRDRSRSTERSRDRKYRRSRSQDRRNRSIDRSLERKNRTRDRSRNRSRDKSRDRSRDRYRERYR